MDPTSEAFAHPFPLSAETLKRIRSDYREVLTSPLPGVIVEPHGSDMSLAHVLITGPDCGPYAHGFFYFRLRFLSTFPQAPPAVKLITTGGGTVRFGPNLYSNGKVCLSLLGTWAGPGWTATQTLSSVLLNIQVLLCEQPLYLEPGYEQGSARVTDAMVEAFNNIVTYRTLEFAVLGNVTDASALPESLRDVVLQSFLEFAPEYAETCGRLAPALDGRPFADPIWQQKGTFAYSALREKILDAARRVEAGELT